MSIISYKPIIDDMTWSYSRIKSYDDCPYQFFLKYIKCYDESDQFYATFGKFIHKLIEQYYKGELSKDAMVMKFLTDFSNEVKGMRPGDKIVQKYISDACKYLREFSPIPCNMIEVEKRVEFSVGDYNFVGFIDYIGEKDGELYVADNKSRNLKPRSGREKPTANDKELDLMLRQLYMYSIAIENEYGMLPTWLCFNCFRTQTFIKEQFDIQKYEETKQWALDSIERIRNEEDFYPNPSFFSCLYICGVNNHCYYDIQTREERRHR